MQLLDNSFTPGWSGTEPRGAADHQAHASPGIRRHTGDASLSQKWQRASKDSRADKGESSS